MKREEEKGIKRWLKRKVSINEALLVLFLITGGTSFASSPEVGYEHYYSEYHTDSGTAADRIMIMPYNAVNNRNENSRTARYTNWNTVTELKDIDNHWKAVGAGSVVVGKVRAAGYRATAVGNETVAREDGTTALGYYARAYDTGGTSLGYFSNAANKFSTATGYHSSATGEFSSAYGAYSQASSYQSIAMGVNTSARAAQSTAIGNDTYALGHASIALGTDDVAPDTGNGYTEAITQYDYDHYFKFLYASTGANIDSDGSKYGFVEGNPSNTAYIGQRKYSPTLSRGIGAISIGSRSIAFDKGSVSIGTLAFALKEGATALGTNTRAEGIGAMALGNESNVFADFSVATGNQTQVLNQGGMAYGYKAYSAGEGSLAIGREVSANAKLLNISEIKAAFEGDTTDLKKLVEAGEKAKFIVTQEKNQVKGIVTQNDAKNYAIVIGNRAAATSHNSLALGRSAFSLSDDSAAIGSFSYADAKDAMAIGVGARAFDDTTKAGHTGIAALAIGKDSLATLENSVALGVGSRTDYGIEDLQKAGYAPKGSLSTHTTAKTGVISVGRKGAERRVVNIASGYLNTDAVNVGQLRALEDAINLNIAEKTGGGLKYFSSNKTGGDSAVLEGKMNIGSDYKTYVEYVSLRKNLSAKKNLNGETIDEEYYNKITEEIGKFEKAHSDFKSLQGIDALDDKTTGNATEDAKKYSLLLQELEKKKKEALAKVPAGSAIDNYHNADNSGAKGADSIAIGYDAETSSTATNAVAIGKTARVNAAKGVALGNAALVDATATSGIAIGENSFVNRADSVAVGRNSRTTGNNLIGYKFAENAAIAPTTVSAYHPFISRPNVFTPNMGEFSIGNGENGTRRLTGLAAGLMDTDAVNVGQYKALASFKWRITTDGEPFNRALTSINALKFEGNEDIRTSAEIMRDTDKVKFALNKLTAINETNKNSEQVATSKAVYTAIKDSKTTLLPSKDGIVTVTGSKTDNITGNTFTVGIDKTKLIETVGADFAKKDASNIDKTAWVEKLGTGADGLVSKTEYSAATGITPQAWRDALGVSGKWSITSGGATSEINKTDDTLTVTGENGITTKLMDRNLTIGVNKSGTVTAGNPDIVTGGTVHTAIDAAKTTLSVNPVTGGALELSNTEGANNAYTLKLNETKLKENLGINTLETEYAKVDASNIAPSKGKWISSLSGEDGFTTSSDYKSAVGIDAAAWKNVLGVSNVDLKYKGNGDTSRIVPLSTGITIQGEKENNKDVSGKNIWVESADAGVLTVKMSDKPNFTEVNVGTNKFDTTGLTVGTSKVTSDGIIAAKGTVGGVTLDGNQMTGLKSGTQAGNAVEYSQFTNAIANTLGKNASFLVRDDAGVGYKVNLSDPSPSVTFKGIERDFVSPGGATTKVKNIVTKIDGSNLVIDLNDKIVLKGASIAGVTFTNEDGKKEIHVGDAKITNLADGEVKPGSRGAVNGGQLYDVQTIAVDGKKTADEAKVVATYAQGTANDALSKATTNTDNIKKNTDTIAEHTATITDHTITLAKHTSSIDKNTQDIAKGFSFTAEEPAVTGESNTVKRALGDSFVISGDGKNISTTIDKDAKVMVSLKENPKFGALTINDGGKITGLSNGIADTDAVNLAQLKPIATAINVAIGADGSVSSPKYTLGTKQYNTIQDAFNDMNTKTSGKIKFIDGDGKSREIALGDTIQFKGTNNNLKVALDPTSGAYSFSIVDNPTFNGVVTANGFNANGQKITNVHAGSEDSDAVTYKQLQEVKSGLSSVVNLTLDSPVTYIAKVEGKDEVIKKVDKEFYKIGDLDKDGKPKEGAKPIVAAAAATIKVSTISKDGGVSSPIRFTNVAAGDISAESKDAINGSQLKPVLDALAMTWDSSSNEIKHPNWQLGNKVFTNIPDVIKGIAKGEVGSLVLTNKNGENVVKAKDNKMYKLSDVNPDTFEPKSGAKEVALEDIRYSALNTTVSEKGTTIPIQVGNLKEGTEENDAVTLKQLKKLGLDPNATDIKTSVTYDDDKKGIITLVGKDDAGRNVGTKITNLADGDISATSKDAITGKQLYSVDSALKTLKENTDKGWKLGINADSAEKVDYDDTIQITSDSNLGITSSLDGTKRTLKIATVASPTFGKIKLENSEESSTITGLTNKTWDRKNITSGRAATEDQLKAAVDNINTSSTEADKFSVKYNKEGEEPDYTKITLKNTYDPKVANSGTKITNVAKGSIAENSSDAINASQLYATNKAMASFIGKDAFDLTTGMIREGVKFPSVTNNGAHADVNDISTALENLRYGFRVFGGKGPVENALDGTAGATNVGNKQNLAILGDDNISTKISKKKDLVVTHEKTNPITGEKETVTETLTIPIVTLSMSKRPTFDAVTAKEVLTVGDASNPDPTKRAVVAINPNGKGHIDGLTNNKFNVGLETLNKSNVETALIVDKTRAATEEQMSKVVKDYVRRDDENIKYMDEKKNTVTLNSTLTDGVKLRNLAKATEDKDAVNLALLKEHSKATADVIGTTVKVDGSIEKPNFAKIGEKQPSSVVDALTLLGEKIKSGTSDVDKKIGDPAKDGTDGRNGSLNPDGSNSPDGKTGAAGQDGLNGKDLNTKANALRRGEAGIVVYTTEAGVRVGKAKDGKYYELSEIKSDGSVEVGATSLEVEKVRHSLVNAKDGLTTSPTALSNLANGKVAKDSSDAVTGDQLHKLGNSLGTVTEDGSLTLNKLKFRGNVSTAGYDKTLGEEVKILGNSFVTNAAQLSEYTEKNVATENTTDGVVVKFSKNPEFTSVKATDSISVGESGIVLNGKAGSITGLKDLDDKADATSAVNKKFVDKKIKEVSDAISGETGLGGKIGTGADGKDGVSGTSGTTGPTGKDGLNGKDLTTKTNALRNGEAGTVVYTDKDGNRLYKGNDGKYYEASKVKADGSVETGAVAVDPTRLSLVNSKGETTASTVLDNLTSGKITDNSKEAINGSQLKNFADKLGLEVEGTDSTKLANAKLIPLKEQFVKDAMGVIYKKEGEKYYKLNPATGNFTTTPINSITGEKALEPKLVDRINLLTALNNDLQVANKKGIIFRGDNDDTTDKTAAAVSLGDTLNIKGGTENPTGYIGGNIRVESSPAGMKIYTKANPTFDSITLNKEGLDKTSAVRLDQLNALRRDLKLPPITKEDPDGNGIAGDQRNPAGVYPDPSSPIPGGSGGIDNSVEALKRGEAGPIVYTTDTGERLVLGGDKKFYRPDDVKGKVYYKDKWYDGTKVKELNGKLYDIKTGKEIKGNEFAVAAPTNYNKEVKLSAVSGNQNSTTPPVSIALGNIADGSAGKDATNVDQLNKIRDELGLAFITPEDKNGDGKNDKDGSPSINHRVTSPSGPTGATGGVGSMGGSEKDNLEGSKMSDKVEYLRDGYAGTVVYTNDDGERVVKGKDNKFYKASDVKNKVYVDGKWYESSTFEKYDLKDGKWVDKGRDTLTTEAPKTTDIKSLDGGVPSLSLVDNKGETTKAVKLKNVANGEVSSNSTDAVNGSQLNAVYDAIKNTGEGKLFDGRDGKSGVDKSGNIVADSAASKGNTSKDYLNGKSVTDKANALRNGEAGTLVYTNEKGDRLFKGNDGKYYTFSDLEGNGNPKKAAKAANKVVSTVVQYDGSTGKAGVIRVAAGKVSSDSTEAVNGSQLNETNKKISQMESKNEARFEAQERAISENTKRMERMDTKVNKGLANAAAISGLTFMDVGANQASIAAAIGGYKGTQAVAVGVQAAPAENVRVNAKFSMTPGSQSEEMYSVGAAYRFNFR